MISILHIYLQADVELKTAETTGQEVTGVEEESAEEICETCDSVEQPQILADQQAESESRARPRSLSKMVDY